MKILTFFFSFSRTNWTYADDGVALHCRILPWHCPQQLHLDSFGIFIAWETSSCVRLAHGWQSYLRHHLWTAHRRNSWLDWFVPNLHSLAKCLHFSLHSCVEYRILHEVFAEKGKEQNSHRDYLSLGSSSWCLKVFNFSHRF